MHFEKLKEWPLFDWQGEAVGTPPSWCSVVPLLLWGRGFNAGQNVCRSGWWHACCHRGNVQHNQAKHSSPYKASTFWCCCIFMCTLTMYWAFPISKAFKPDILILATRYEESFPGQWCVVYSHWPSPHFLSLINGWLSLVCKW